VLPILDAMGKSKSKKDCVSVGCLVGLEVGALVGFCVGIFVGLAVGLLVGRFVGKVATLRHRPLDPQRLEQQNMSYWPRLKHARPFGWQLLSNSSSPSPSPRPRSKRKSPLLIVSTGRLVGRFVGIFVGSLVGFFVGLLVGLGVGRFVGCGITAGALPLGMHFPLPPHFNPLQQYPSPAAHDSPSRVHLHRPFFPHLLEQQNLSALLKLKHNPPLAWHWHFLEELHPPWQQEEVSSLQDLESARQVSSLARCRDG